MDDKEAKVFIDMLKELQCNMDSFHANIKELNTELHTSFDSMHTQLDSLDKSLDRISQLAEEEIQREKNRKAQYAEMLERLKNGTQ
ncbi:hypothetical protein ACVNNN_20065 [Lysinibacillus fusiformis]|uniref:hypothetical protein n=1 Tax=Lysinibacillus sp. PWR01 TaxID=3342384 RepID=UPI00372D6A1A